MAPKTFFPGPFASACGVKGVRRPLRLSSLLGIFIVVVGWVNDMFSCTAVWILLLKLYRGVASVSDIVPIVLTRLCDGYYV